MKFLFAMWGIPIALLGAIILSAGLMSLFQGPSRELPYIFEMYGKFCIVYCGALTAIYAYKHLVED